jgi:hypothetical protein
VGDGGIEWTRRSAAKFRPGGGRQGSAAAFVLLAPLLVVNHSARWTVSASDATGGGLQGRLIQRHGTIVLRQPKRCTPRGCWCLLLRDGVSRPGVWRLMSGTGAIPPAHWQSHDSLCSGGSCQRYNCLVGASILQPGSQHGVHQMPSYLSVTMEPSLHNESKSQNGPDSSVELSCERMLFSRICLFVALSALPWDRQASSSGRCSGSQ